MILWLRTHLLVQGTQGQSLVLEDATCHGAAKLCSAATESLRPGARAPQEEKPPQGEAHALQLESSPCL